MSDREVLPHQSTPDVRIERDADCLQLWVDLPNARLRCNRFPGDPVYVEAVVFDGGELAIGQGFSPPLDDVDLAEDFAVALDSAR